MTQHLESGGGGEFTVTQRGKQFTGVKNTRERSRIPVIYTNPRGKTVCSALISDGSRFCESEFILSNGRCKRHGGMTPSGVASPHFKSGRHSRQLPTRLLERYEEALSDPEMHSLEAEIALVDARIADLLAQCDDGGGGDIFFEIDDAFASFKTASQDGDRRIMRESLARLDSAVARGKSEQDIWVEIRALQEQRRKLVLSEAKRLQTTNQMVTVTRVNLLISALLDAVRQEVTDRSTLARVSERFVRITQGEAKKLSS
jgi:hypothetical protein